MDGNDDGFGGVGPPSARDIDVRVRERQLAIAYENARFGLLPLVLAALCYAVALAEFVSPRRLAIWLLTVLLLLGMRGLLAYRYQAAADRADTKWLYYQFAIATSLGLAYGVTGLWLRLPEEIALVAVVNVWLGGLAVATLIGQGIVPVLGTAFAIPALAPLLFRMLASESPILTALGIGNILFYLFVFSTVVRAQKNTLDEVRHRVATEMMAVHLQQERAKGERLVTKLRAEIARRKRVAGALKRARNALQRSLDIDHLTGLANQRTLDRALRQEWTRARRYHRPVSLILCDVDRFRAYNERYGHHAGDLCLTRVARVLDAACGHPKDLAARYGGEEFALLLPDTGEYAAREIADGIRSSVYDMTMLHGASDTEKVVTVSCGVATLIPDGIRSESDLVEAAALALKHAKAAGRNCVYAVYGAPVRDEI
jgi:diguanylate cyclase (GGDEF)-like protein